MGIAGALARGHYAPHLDLNPNLDLILPGVRSGIRTITALVAPPGSRSGA